MVPNYGSLWLFYWCHYYANHCFSEGCHNQDSQFHSSFYIAYILVYLLLWYTFFIVKHLILNVELGGFYIYIVKGFQSKMEEDMKWRISFIHPQNRTYELSGWFPVNARFTEYWDLSLDSELNIHQDISPHPQANELAVWTLAGLSPLCTPCPQIQPLSPPQTLKGFTCKLVQPHFLNCNSSEIPE